MQQLRWSHWGSKWATGVGITHGFHEGPSITLYVQAWGLKRSSCTNGNWYTWLTASSHLDGFTYRKTFRTAYC